MLPPLFCKPSNGVEPYKSLFTYGPVSFRSLDLELDLHLIHPWVTHPQAKEFWQLDESIDKVEEIYADILENPNGHSFIAAYNDRPVAQVDVYRVLEDEVKEHLPGATLNDCGMHLLMAPAENKIKSLTTTILAAFLQYYFSFSQAEKMYGEPDRKNHKAIQLIRKLGFVFLKEVPMSYKTASLHSITKSQFYAAHPIL